jgi:hypothetical protein
MSTRNDTPPIRTSPRHCNTSYCLQITAGVGLTSLDYCIYPLITGMLVSNVFFLTPGCCPHRQMVSDKVPASPYRHVFPAQAVNPSTIAAFHFTLTSLTRCHVGVLAEFMWNCVTLSVYGYWNLKEEALDRTLWRTSFRRGYGPVARHTT